MPNPYSSKALSADAMAFAKSRFGRHYIARLKRLRKDARDKAEDLRLDRDYRMAQVDRASAYSSEIRFFAIAKKVKEGVDKDV